jgi:hypothetical protein
MSQIKEVMLEQVEQSVSLGESIFTLFLFFSTK